MSDKSNTMLFTQEQAEQIAYVINQKLNIHIVDPETFTDMDDIGDSTITENVYIVGMSYLFDGPFDTYFEYQIIYDSSERSLLMSYRTVGVLSVLLISSKEEQDVYVNWSNRAGIEELRDSILAKQHIGPELEGLLDL